MASTTRKEERPDKRVNQQQGSTKLYSRMLSKDVAIAVPSFRVYYGVASAGSVPFLWESQPGTPKSSPSAAALPPLTPPPSYYAAGGKGGSKRGGAGGSGRRWPGGVIALFRRPRRRTSPCSSSSISWSSSSSTASSMSPVFTVQSSPFAARGSAGAHRRAFSAGDVFEDAAAPSSCFGTDRECDRRVVKGCGVAVAVRNALATVVGHKPGGRATSAMA
ncbi:uncharacterized protein LOC125519585 [Triticum urartu]|uniref:uncharacterized protein LOC125519585 n=1 Tax=Triticum urartu TaxID=4572 RepID=UPI00204340D4|nr:uncharacterized protein LOC125519585 [Triticum urartu]